MRIIHKEMSLADFIDHVADKNDPKVVAYDIETRPLPDDVLEKMLDFEPPEHPGAFDPKAVAIPRNYTKPKSIEEYIARKQAEHEELLEDYPRAVEAARIEALNKLRDKSTLCAAQSTVCAIGFCAWAGGGIATKLVIPGNDPSQGLDAEYECLMAFSRIAAAVKRVSGILVGHNSEKFDAPFLLRRAWIRGIRMPQMFTDDPRWPPKPMPFLRDTSKVWALGVYNEYIKLDVIAKGFGYEGKATGMSGKDFWKLVVDGGKNAMQLAHTYLLDDVISTLHVATAMGISV